MFHFIETMRYVLCDIYGSSCEITKQNNFFNKDLYSPVKYNTSDSEY